VQGLYGHTAMGRSGPSLYRHYVVDVVDACHSELKRQTGKTAAQLPWGTRVKGVTRVKGEHIMAQISVDAVQKMLDKVIRAEGL
jgi:heptosyltransferase I